MLAGISNVMRIRKLFLPKNKKRFRIKILSFISPEKITKKHNSYEHARYIYIYIIFIIANSRASSDDVSESRNNRAI